MALQLTSLHFVCEPAPRQHFLDLNTFVVPNVLHYSLFSQIPGSYSGDPSGQLGKEAEHLSVREIEGSHSLCWNRTNPSMLLR